MKKQFFLLFTIILLVLSSCKQEMKYQNLIRSYEDRPNLKIEFIEDLSSFTARDSLKILENTLNKHREDYIALLDSTLVEVKKNRLLAISTKTTSLDKSKLGESQFQNIIDETDHKIKKIENAKIIATTNGRGTVLEDYYDEIDYWKRQGSRTLFHRAKARWTKGEETVTKIYFLSLDRTAIEGVAIE